MPTAAAAAAAGNVDLMGLLYLYHQLMTRMPEAHLYIEPSHIQVKIITCKLCMSMKTDDHTPSKQEYNLSHTHTPCFCLMP